MSKANKFAFIRDVAQERETELSATPEAEQEPQPPAPEPTAPTILPNVQQRTKAGHLAIADTSHPAPPKKMGRPPGKRSNPDYEQVTAYIRRDTHLAIKLALLQEGQGREFSELVEELLIGYLRTQKSKDSNP